MTISSWLNFGHPAPPARGSAAGRKFLAPPYYRQRTVFVSLSAFFIIGVLLSALSLCSGLFRCSYRVRLCDSLNLLTERFEMPVYYYYLLLSLSHAHVCRHPSPAYWLHCIRCAQGLKCNFKVVGMVKNTWVPSKNLWALLVLQRPPVFLVQPLSWPNSDWLIYCGLGSLRSHG